MRSINSPGIQITERDLSLVVQPPVGTSVFACGFAAEGPTDVALQITSIPELENVFGKPTTPAERYFHHTCRQVLNTPGKLIASRLPYGQDNGTGYSSQQYSGLLYPVVSSPNQFNLEPPVHLSFNEDEFNSIMEGNFIWSTASGPGGSKTTSTMVLSTVIVSPAMSAAKLADIATIDPTFTIDFVASPGNTTFIFDQQVFTTTPIGAAGYSYNTTSKVVTLTGGFIIMNKAQTIIDHTYSGYYVAITDNSNIGPGSDFDSIKSIYSLSSTNNLYRVPDTKLGFDLTALASTPKDSLSEMVERTQSYYFADPYYQDSVLINLFRFYRSNNEPQKLATYLVETHAGSFDQVKKELSTSGSGKTRSFFLENTVNENSSNLSIFVNPEVSFRNDWSSKTGNTPPIAVRTAPSTQAAFPLGVYMPTYLESTNKQLGNIVTKLERALDLVNSTENVIIDVVVDGGISTINAWKDDVTELFEDEIVKNNGQITLAINGDWKSIFNIFDTFVRQNRKDCVFISDPLRNIFVNGTTKTMGKKTSVFTSTVYNPLKMSYVDANSNYSTTYGNWVKVLDPSTDKLVWVPFSGFAAAIFCKNDAVAYPWSAPAGLNRGIVTGINDVAFNPNQKQRDYMYQIAVNPVVFFNGDGFAIYGQKTLQTKPSAFDRLNVRRLFLALERATVNVAKYFVFEPNTALTRSRLIATLSPIFELAKLTEGLYDYLLVCDDRNNSALNVDNNELIVDIYLKPVRTAEFILINFIATRTSQNFEELI
jgi:hypothetical protein